MIKSKRIVLVDKENLQLDLEYNKDFAILHLPRMKMNKTTYTDFLTTVPDIYEFIETVGYEALHTAIEPNDRLTAKLLNRLGAKKLGTDGSLDVYEYTGEN